MLDLKFHVVDQMLESQEVRCRIPVPPDSKLVPGGHECSGICGPKAKTHLHISP